MSRNWQDIFQKGQGFSNQAIDQLSGIEVDLATALSGGSAASLTLSDVLANGADAAGQDMSGIGDVSLDGLTGATAGGRFVGATTSGSPITGTFRTGDFVVDQSGGIRVCTVGGSPGTWVSISAGSGTEIGYDQITTTVSVASTSSASPTTVITCSSHTFDGGAVYLEFFCPYIDTGTSGQFCNIGLYESSSLIALIGRAYAAGTQVYSQVSGRLRFTPSSGAHSYVIGAYNNTGTTSVSAGTGTSGAWVPTFVRFVKA